MSINENNTNKQVWYTGLIKVFNINKYNLEKKLRAILILIAIVTIAIVASIALYVSKIEAKESGNTHLRSIREAKRQYIEDYFSSLSNQVSMLSKDQVIINALSEFSQAFNTLEYDNYLTQEATSVKAIDEKLANYYQTDYIPSLNKIFDKDYQYDAIYPQSTTTKIVQYLYIAANKQPFEKKYLLDKARDNSRYSDVHAGYHNDLINYSKIFGFDDIMLVDNVKGNVVYSLKKDFSFGTNLMTGIYRNSNLARLYKNAMLGSKNFVEISDYEIFLPSLGEPSMFIAAPIYSNNQRIGVLIGKLSNERIHNILTSNNNWQLEGLGNTGQIYLVGKDRRYRSNVRALLENKEEYIDELRKLDLYEEDITKIDHLNSNIVLDKNEMDAVRKALKGNIVEQIDKNKIGKKVLISAVPLNIKNLNWIIVSQKELDEIYAPLKRMRSIIILSSLIFTVLSFFIAKRIAYNISFRIIKIRDNLEALSEGKNISIQKDKSEDEISQAVLALNHLSQRTSDASKFVEDIGSGNLDVNFKAFDDKDKFGLSLNQMKESLVHARSEEEKRKNEDEIRAWSSNGVAKFAEVLRTNNQSVQQLSYAIIRELVDYIDANIAGIFILNEEDSNHKILQLQASYAYDRQKNLEKEIEMGEGLVGTCAVEKKPIYLKEIPENYIEITSGFGQAPPCCLLLIPLIVDDILYGVIEIGALNKFPEYKRDFVIHLAESIASTMVTVRLNIKTQELLKESELRANEIAQQEEEMRQNMEEMIATQEELDRIKKEQDLQTKDITNRCNETQTTIQNILDKMPGSVLIKDSDGIVKFANRRAAELNFMDHDELIGTTGLEELEEAEKEMIQLEESDILNSKEVITYTKKESSSGKKYFKVIKSPYVNSFNNEKYLMVWELDYTDIYKQVGEDTAEEMNEYKEKLKDAIKELKSLKSGRK